MNYNRNQALYQKQRHAEKKCQVIDHYSHGKMKCNLCPVFDVDVLCLDHINDGGEAHRNKVGRTSLYEWIVRKKFPVGFQILCANCNLKKQMVRNNLKMLERTYNRSIRKK